MLHSIPNAESIPLIFLLILSTKELDSCHPWNVSGATESLESGSADARRFSWASLVGPKQTGEMWSRHLPVAPTAHQSKGNRVGDPDRVHVSQRFHGSWFAARGVLERVRVNGPLFFGGVGDAPAVPWTGGRNGRVAYLMIQSTIKSLKTQKLLENCRFRRR